ncbi:MAG: glycosyltransferase family 4 protein [Candidatus Dojkabacteria bacterium]
MDKIKKFIGIYQNFGLSYFLDLIIRKASFGKINLNIKPNFDKFLENNVSSDHSKKQIIFFVPWFTFGGTDIVNYTLLNNMDQTKFQFHLFSTIRGANNIWFDKFKAINNEIFHLPDLISEDNYEELIKKYIKYVNAETFFVSNSSKGYDLIPFVRREFPQIKIVDLLHGQGGSKESGGFPEYSKNLDKYIDTRIAINNFLKNYLIEKYNIDPKKITVIQNAIEFSDKVEKGIYRSKQKVDENEFVVTYLGRLAPEKHPEIIVKIANELVNNQGVGNISFFIGGDGPLFDEVSKEIRTLKLGNKIHLLGYYPNNEAVKILSDSNLLAVTSEMEGSPIVILEAMNLGVPVLASKVGGIPEQVDDQITGVLIEFNENFVETAAQEILELKNNREKLSSMGLKSKEKATTTFSVKEMISKYESSL